MSESRAFANFSNTSRALQSSAGQQQEGRTFQDTVDDAKNFEQQFLIGMAVHQKAKVGDNLVKLFKGSKKLKSATGLSEDDLANIAKGDFSGVTKKISSDLSKKLQIIQIYHSKTLVYSSEQQPDIQFYEVHDLVLIHRELGNHLFSSEPIRERITRWVFIFNI